MGYLRADVFSAELGILCVGWPRAFRESGDAIDHVLAQVRQSLPDGFDRSRLAIAYEPIWAIGTGLVPTLEDVAAMHGSIRAALSERIGAGAADLRLDRKSTRLNSSH